MVYRVAVSVIGVLVRPRSTFAGLAESPRVALGFVVVLGSGLVALLLGLLANLIDGGGSAGALASLVLPLLFLMYWAASALIVDAGAGLAGHAGRWRQYLGVSGFTLIPWVAYGVLSVIEALVGTGSAGGVDRRVAHAAAPRLVSRPDHARRSRPSTTSRRT